MFPRKVVSALLISWLFLSGLLLAQAIPRDEYIDYLPLHHARLVGQTAASAELNLFGNKSDPNYRDRNPEDGIDDSRFEILQKIALQFAPYLVQNTNLVPIDFKAFIETRGTFPLHIDTWDISMEDAEIVAAETIDFASLGLSDCQSPIYRAKLADTSFASSENEYGFDHEASANSDDCRLLALLEEFRPDHSGGKVNNGVEGSPDRELFKALYFDLPGNGPDTWKPEYENGYTKQLAGKYRDFIKIFAHPFLSEVRTKTDRKLLGYEFVCQYWFYYPYNDGGNDHEGDWEHINVVISPMNRVEGLLSAEEIQSILRGDWLYGNDADDALVIKRIEVYFHHFVMPLDYSKPNVYKPKEEWKNESRHILKERFDEDETWKAIRYLAYLDDEETRINTHPFCYIGADNKGLDQVLTVPGGKNRDSHGTYPFPGMYKNIGPAGATETIATYIDHRKYFKKIAEQGEKKPLQYKRNNVVGFDRPERLEIIPDWERVIDLMQTSREVRRNWSWLLLPIQWGYPATVSPFAGIVKNTDTGNIGPIGPSFNSGWNRTMGTPNFRVYEPHRLPAVFPVGFNDSFQNNLGFLNLTYPVLSNLPPLDFAWRIVAYPFRLAFKRPEPVFYPQEGIPSHFVGFAVAASMQYLPDDFNALYLNEKQFDEFFGGILVHLILNGIDSTTTATELTEFNDDDFAPAYQVAFYIGDHFVTENTFRHSRTRYGFTASFSNIPSYTYSANLNFWELSGSMRYNLRTSRLQPYLKGGYGWSWYRLEDARADGIAFDAPNSDWIRQPSVFPFKNLLPNTWHFGGGLEFIILKGYGKIPKGIDVSIRTEYLWFAHSLGLDLSNISLDKLKIAFPTLGDVPTGGTVTRRQINFALTLGF